MVLNFANRNLTIFAKVTKCNFVSALALVVNPTQMGWGKPAVEGNEGVGGGRGGGGSLAGNVSGLNNNL